MKDIKVGIIGFGQRGKSLLTGSILPQANVTAVCDLYDDRAQEAADCVVEGGQPKPAIYKNYMDVINDENVNTIIVTTSWESHIEIAIAAMNAGKPVAVEVGGAYSLNECFELVETQERTQTPFMFLENCCFGKREMMVLNMVEKGLLGKIAHCSGGYHHDLREEITGGIKNRHYRLRNYLTRNCENYPTHELGPIAKILKINHGNRMLTLSSTASGSAGLHDYIMKNLSDDEFLANASFNQGDVITTVIKCANGETIVITLDTTLPRYYSRGFTVRGTNGMYEEATDSIFLDRKEDIEKDFSWRNTEVGNAEKYEEEWLHPVWKEYEAEGVQGTHDGMDWLEFKTFFNCLKEDKPMPVDVYDAASWMAITALSTESVAQGGAVVSIPDFTKGKWVMNNID